MSLEANSAEGSARREADGAMSGIYLVTDPRLCADIGVVETVRQAVTAGVRLVQIRNKMASTREFVDEVVAASEVAAEASDGGARVIVNDRIDVFLAAVSSGAPVHGVHVGQKDLGVTEVRRRVGSQPLLGLSASAPHEFDRIGQLPYDALDYVGVGAIRATSTKLDHPPVLGVDGFAALAGATALPCVAIGGLGLGQVVALRDAGATAVAVVSAICGTASPFESARSLVEAWQSVREEAT